MALTALSGLTLILGYAVFHQGGVYSQHWNLSLLSLGVLALMYLLGSWRAPRAPRLEPVMMWLTVLLPAYAAFQLLPLPLVALKILSPHRAQLLQALQRVDPSVTFAPLTIVPPESLAQVLRIVACVVTFLLVRELAWRTPDRPWMMTIPLVGIAVLEAVLGLAQYSMHAGEAVGTYRNRNHFAALLELALPFALMYAIAIIRRIREQKDLPIQAAFQSGILLICAGILFLGIARSSSRMGFLACLASLFVLGTFSLSAAFSGKGKLLIIGSPAMVLLAALIFLTPGGLISRFGDLTPKGELADGRVLIWRDTLHLIAAYPIFGCGMGGFEPALLRYKTSLPLSTVNFAHNDYLQFAAELGIVGFAIAAGLMFLLFKAALSKILALTDQDTYCLALACLGSMVAILLHSLVDFNMYVPANSMVFAWIAGIAAGPNNR